MTRFGSRTTIVSACRRPRQRQFAHGCLPPAGPNPSSARGAGILRWRHTDLSGGLECVGLSGACPAAARTTFKNQSATAQSHERGRFARASKSRLWPDV